MSIEVEKEINFGKVLFFALAIAILVIFIGNKVFDTSPLKPDSDCLEWGVFVTNPNGTQSWAITSHDPKTREEAEQIAQQMENQDMGNRYYEAKCKRYK